MSPIPQQQREQAYRGLGSKFPLVPFSKNNNLCVFTLSIISIMYIIIVQMSYNTLMVSCSLLLHKYCFHSLIIPNQFHFCTFQITVKLPSIIQHFLHRCIYITHHQVQLVEYKALGLLVFWVDKDLTNNIYLCDWDTLLACYCKVTVELSLLHKDLVL